MRKFNELNSALFTEREIALFWNKVDKTGEHWLWTAAVNNKGYGKLHIWRLRLDLTAHRTAWFLQHGPIPEGMLVLHDCDIRRCVRHLSLGTDIKNMQDALARGRSIDRRTNPLQIRGEDHAP